jgi:hypothetical protein
MRSRTGERSLRRGALLAAWVLMGLAVSAGPAGGEVIESILAVVDGRPLMLSDVELLERLRSQARGPALEALIDEALMFRDASRLPATLVTAEDEASAFAGLSERVGADAARFESGLRRLARRQVAILKYVDFRFGPQVRVDDEAVRAAYALEFGGRSDAPELEAVQAELRARLIRKELDDAVEAWVRELRSAAEIRYNP